MGLHGLFVVIGFVVEDREGAVDLLGEDRRTIWCEKVMRESDSRPSARA